MPHFHCGSLKKAYRKKLPPIASHLHSPFPAILSILRIKTVITAILAHQQSLPPTSLIFQSRWRQGPNYRMSLVRTSTAFTFPGCPEANTGTTPLTFTDS